MANIFDTSDIKDPDDRAGKDAALWAIGAALLGGRGNFASIAGSAAQAGLGAYGTASDSSAKKRLAKSQIDENTSQAQSRQFEMWRKMRNDEIVNATLQNREPAAWATMGGVAMPDMMGAGGGTATGAVSPSAAPGAAVTPTTPGPVAGVPPTAPTPTQRTKLPSLTDLGLDPRALALARTAPDGGGSTLATMIQKVQEKQYVNDQLVNANAPNAPRSLPTISRDGKVSITVPDGKGGWFNRPVDGSVETLGAFANAEERAKAANDLVEVTLPSGKKETTTRLRRIEQMPDAPGTAPGAAPGAAAAPAGQPNELQTEFQRLTSDLEAGQASPKGQPSTQEKLAMLAGEARRRGVDLYSQMAPGGKINPNATTDPRLGAPPAGNPGLGGPQTASAGGTTPSAPQIAPRAANSGPPLIQPSDAELGASRVTQEGMARNYVERASAYPKATARAYDKLQSLDQQARLLEGLATGKFSTAKVEGLRAIQALTGLDLSEATLGKKIGNAEAAESIAIGMANDMREPGTGTMTETDFTNFKRQVPGLVHTVEGNKLISEFFRKMYTRQYKEGEAATNYIKIHGALDAGWDQQLNAWRKMPENQVTLGNVPGVPQ